MPDVFTVFLNNDDDDDDDDDDVTGNQNPGGGNTPLYGLYRLCAVPKGRFFLNHFGHK